MVVGKVYPPIREEPDHLAVRQSPQRMTQCFLGSTLPIHRDAADGP
jgi:hypothetical protein